jgi:hypothetical protein
MVLIVGIGESAEDCFSRHLRPGWVLWEFQKRAVTAAEAFSGELKKPIV